MEKKMKKLLFLVIFLFGEYFSVEKYGAGDPFFYIKSTIPEIKNKTEFLMALEDQTKIIAIISYNNNFYGNDFEIFSNIARIYSEISNMFSNQKKIKFYRVKMLKGIYGSFVSRSYSNITFFYNKEYIGKINETEKKDVIAKYILDLIKKIFI